MRTIERTGQFKRRPYPGSAGVPAGHTWERRRPRRPISWKRQRYRLNSREYRGEQNLRLMIGYAIWEG